jgi:hypothetical protein
MNPYAKSASQLLSAMLAGGLLLGCGGGGSGSSTSAGNPPASITLPATPLGSDLMGVVTDAQWQAVGGTTLGYSAAQQGFPITTDVNTGTTNHDGYQKGLVSPSSPLLKAGHTYQFVVRIKTDVFPMGQNIVISVVDLAHQSEKFEHAWNVSQSGTWEEVYLPIAPVVDGNWVVKIWGSNGGIYATTPSTMYVSPDIDLYELPAGYDIATLRNINTAADKDAFESSTERIDGLGNIYTKAENSTVWKHIFPKMIYRGTGAVNTASLTEMCKRYKEYGFTGLMDVWTGTDAQTVIDAGLEHISINAFSGGQTLTYMQGIVDNVSQWEFSTNQSNRHQNVLWYYVDNEVTFPGDYTYQVGVQTHIDALYLDPVTGKRRHPIYYLNGQIGLPRSLHNNSRKVMDITGAYVPNYGYGLWQTPLVPTLLSQFMTQNQRAPVTVIQLQAYLQDAFIPALFYGIIQGGRAMSVWRDGTTSGGAMADFRDNVWATAFRDDVSPKIDQMLPLIEQPHFTNWKASTNQFPNVRIGTRELNGTGHLILANFAATDLPVVVNLQGRQASKAVDMFTGAAIADVVNGSFQFTLGHSNNGYRVIRLN